MSRRLALTLAMLVVGTALLVASGLARPVGSASTAAEARKGGTLRVASLAVRGPLDTGLNLHIPLPISFATCAKLFNHPDEAGKSGTQIVPEVVNSHTVSRDGRIYEFELKRTFRFHTGAPVTAQSFADAFNRTRSPS